MRYRREGLAGVVGGDEGALMPDQIIIIPGKPIAKKRPRFARRGKFVKTYSAQETEEGRTFLEIKSQWKQKPLDCPVIVEMTFLFPITNGSKKAV